MNKILTLTYALGFLGTAIATLASTQAIFGNQSSDDPVAHINYPDAFNQKKIHVKFKPLMKDLKCDKNVFQEKDKNPGKMPDAEIKTPRFSSRSTLTPHNANPFHIIDIDHTMEAQNSSSKPPENQVTTYASFCKDHSPQERKLKTKELLALHQKALQKDPDAYYKLGKYIYKEESHQKDVIDIERIEIAIQYLQLAAQKKHSKAKKYLNKVNNLATKVKDRKTSISISNDIDNNFRGNLVINNQENSSSSRFISSQFSSSHKDDEVYPIDSNFSESSSSTPLLAHNNNLLYANENVKDSLIGKSYKTQPKWKSYKKECISKLEKARFIAITKQARTYGTALALVLASTFATYGIVDANSDASGIVLSSSVLGTAYLLHPIIGDIWSYFFTPSHPVDKRERRFAKNQCFIPKSLWNPIIDAFMTARKNSNEAQQKDIKFIDFMLGLTIHRPQLPIQLRRDLHGNAHTKITNFFKNYENIKNLEEFYKLVSHIETFTLSLIGGEKLTRYIYLCGPGGIGKTHFVLQLCKWLNEVTGNAIHLETKLKNMTSDKLEGSEKKEPGVFLKVLREVHSSKKAGAIVFMDEADWLHKNDMASSVKRVFNGEFAQIPTTYFGLQENDIHLKYPPTLVILAYHIPLDPTKDEPLNSRFDTFNFPLPKQQALASYGEKLFKDKLNIGDVPDFVTNRIKECKSFREVESIIPALVIKSQIQNNDPKEDNPVILDEFSSIQDF